MGDQESSETIGPQRLEAFSDGVIAIILTVMVLELKVPHGVTWSAVEELLPELASYVLSFIVIATIWVNHHHVIRLVDRVDGVFLWQNIHLLFWMSLIPLTTTYAGEYYRDPLPIAIYGANVGLFSLAFMFLLRGVRKRARPCAAATALHDRGERKSLLAIGLYAFAIACAWISTWISIATFVVTITMYLLPDRMVGKG